MEALMSVAAVELQKFLLIFARVTTMIFLFPIFGSNQIPAYLKAGLSAAITYVLFWVLPPASTSALGMAAFLTQVAVQVTVGIIIGYTAFVVFMGILLMGQIVDIEMGFALANVIDPVSNIQQSLIGQFQNLLAFMFFLAIDGHHKLIMVLSQSFHLIPLGRVFTLREPVGSQVEYMFGTIFSLALKLAFPIVAAMFLTDLILGLLSRLVPQMNVFVVGFPIKLGMGLWVLIFMVGTFGVIYPDIFDHAMLDLLHLTRYLGGRPAPGGP